MKVLMYGWEFPPHISGGLGIACYGIVQALLRQHIHIHLILPRSQTDTSTASDPPLPAMSTTTHLTLRFIDSLLRPYLNETTYQQQFTHTLNAEALFYGMDLVAEVRRYALAAGQLAQDIEHDVIHTHDWLTVLAGVMAKSISGKPLLFHVHSLESDRSGEHVNQAIVDIEREGLQQADRIFAVSYYTRQCIMQQYGIAGDKIVVVYNGMPEAYLQNRPPLNLNKPNIVLFLGRVTHQKGPFHFVEAARKILAVRQDIHFALAGEGDLFRSVIEYTASLRLGAYISFLGFLDRELVRRTYEISRVYVMPSISEPFGIACLEALTLQVPVIISRQSGVSEVLNHAFKVDFWDINAMVEKIVALIDYPALTTESLKNSQSDLDCLHWDKLVTAIIKTYQEFY